MAKKAKKKLSELDSITLGGMTAEHMRRLIDEDVLDTLQTYLHTDIDREPCSPEQLLDDMLESLSPLLHRHALFARVLFELISPMSPADVRTMFDSRDSNFLSHVNITELWDHLHKAREPIVAETARSLEKQRYECKSQIDALKAMKKKYSDIVIPPKLLDKYNDTNEKLREIYLVHPRLEPSISDEA